MKYADRVFTEEDMRTIGEYADGYAAALGTANGKWYGGVVELKTFYTTYRELADTDDYDQYAETVRAWDRAALNEQRRLYFVDGTSRAQIAVADRICGPVAPKGNVDQPVLAWTENMGDKWTLKFWVDGEKTTVYESSEVLSWPAVAIVDGDPVVACEARDGRLPIIHIFDADGTSRQTLVGQHPKMTAADGRLFVVVERGSRNETRSVVVEVGADEFAVPQVDAHVFNGDILAVKGRGSKAIHIVCETSPRWGETQRVGELRKLRTWKLEDGEITPFPESNLLRVSEDDCADADSYGDWPPIRPMLFLNGNVVCMAFRKNRRWSRGYSFAWDLYLTTLADDGWAMPIRLTEHPCLPDVPIGIVAQGSGYVAALMQFDHGGTWRAIENTRLGIYQYNDITSLDLPKVEVQPFGRMEALSPVDICLAPPALDCDTSGRQLLWGDMHRHTIYSHCMSTTDGMPDEHIRYVRDTLGCDVVCLTDHAHHMSEIEFQWVMDQLETESAGLVVIYGSEPNPDKGRHTNFYTLGRLHKAKT